MSSVKKNLFYYFLLSLSQVLLPLISIPYISRVLDPEGVGRVSFMDSFTYYFVAIAEFGISVYGARAVARLTGQKEAMGKLVSELVLLHIFSSLITLVVYGMVVFMLAEKISDLRLIGFSLLFLVCNSLSCEWYFLATERFKYIAFRSLAIRLTALVSILMIIKRPEDYLVYYGIMVCSSIMIIAWNFIILCKEHPIRFRNVNWSRHVKYTWVTYLISLVYCITLYLDNVLLGILSGAYAVGVYAFAMKIARSSGVLLTDSLVVIFPRVVRFLKDNNRTDLQNMMNRTVQMIIIFATPLFAGTYLLSDEIVLAVLGRNFIESAEDLRILAFFPFLKAYNLFLSNQILIPHNKEKSLLVSLSVGSVIFVFLAVIFIPVYADKAICFAVIMAELISLAINFSFVKKADPHIIVFNFRTLCHSIGASLLFIPVTYAVKSFYSTHWVVLLWSVAICMIVYLAAHMFVFRNDFVLSVKDSVIHRMRRQMPKF